MKAMLCSWIQTILQATSPGTRGLAPQDLLRLIVWDCLQGTQSTPPPSFSLVPSTLGVQTQENACLLCGCHKGRQEDPLVSKNLHNRSVIKLKLPYINFCFVNSGGKFKSLWEMSHHKLFSAIVTFQRLADSCDKRYKMGVDKEEGGRK